VALLFVGPEFFFPFCCPPPEPLEDFGIKVFLEIFVFILRTRLEPFFLLALTGSVLSSLLLFRGRDPSVDSDLPLSFTPRKVLPVETVPSLSFFARRLRKLFTLR